VTLVLSILNQTPVHFISKQKSQNKLLPEMASNKKKSGIEGWGYGV
jgi:hypothetical protein